MTERFAQIPGYEGLYSVTDAGRIWDCRRNRFRALVPHTDGYPTVRLSRDGTSRRFYVHRLVCVAFNGPPPFAGAQVAHRDGTPANAAVSNLRWSTQAENEADKTEHGRSNAGARHPMVRLTAEDVATIRARVGAGETQTSVRRDYPLSSGHISDIVTGKKWVEGESAVTAKQGDAQ